MKIWVLLHSFHYTKWKSEECYQGWKLFFDFIGKSSLFIFIKNKKILFYNLLGILFEECTIRFLSTK